MTIRKKIFILAGILLALFGLVVGALAFVQKLNNDQIGNIVAYELPLSRLVAEFDVYTDRYELGQRFHGSNHIRQPRRACRTRCGGRDGD
jgi:adenylate cyclase